MKSLREQMLKAGLADQPHANKARSQKKPKLPKKLRGQASESAKLAERLLQEKSARDRELNRQRQSAAEQKAALAQVNQLIESSKLDRREGEHSYNFTVAGRVKSLAVTELQRTQLIRKQIAIVASTAGRFELVPKKVADKIAIRDPGLVIEHGSSEQTGTVADDPYADYQIPDDLVW